jgi:membrane protease YdiL (CAAX protease family)
MNPATLTGLAIALFGLLGVALLTRTSIGRGESINRHREHVLTVAGIAALTIVLLAIVVFWEKQPLSSIGLKPPTLDAVFWGLGLAVAYIYLLGPLLMALPGWLGLKGYDVGLEKTANFPWWYIVLTIIVFGFAKEILFCGYVIERLSSITGYLWLACCISALAATIALVPMGGWGETPSIFVSGVIAALLYVWFRDLTPLIVANITANIMGGIWAQTDKQKTA